MFFGMIYINQLNSFMVCCSIYSEVQISLQIQGGELVAHEYGGIGMWLAVDHLNRACKRKATDREYILGIGVILMLRPPCSTGWSP